MILPNALSINDFLSLRSRCCISGPRGYNYPPTLDLSNRGGELINYSKSNWIQKTQSFLIGRITMADKYYFLKVGCADCTVMHLGTKVVMVDCRQGYTTRGEADILDYIPNNKIDLLIITHQHYDHFDGIQTLIDNDIEVVELWECNYDRRHNDSSVDYDEWQMYQRLRNKLGAKIYCPTRSM